MEDNSIDLRCYQDLCVLLLTASALAVCALVCVNSALLAACQQLLDRKTTHSRNTGTELSTMTEQANLETPACV